MPSAESGECAVVRTPPVKIEKFLSHPLETSIQTLTQNSDKSKARISRFTTPHNNALSKANSKEHFENFVQYNRDCVSNCRNRDTVKQLKHDLDQLKIIHESLLSGLYRQVDDLKSKNSDLTFKLIMGQCALGDTEQINHSDEIPMEQISHREEINTDAEDLRGFEPKELINFENFIEASETVTSIDEVINSNGTHENAFDLKTQDKETMTETNLVTVSDIAFNIDLLNREDTKEISKCDNYLQASCESDNLHREYNELSKIMGDTKTYAYQDSETENAKIEEKNSNKFTNHENIKESISTTANLTTSLPESDRTQDCNTIKKLDNNIQTLLLELKDKDAENLRLIKKIEKLKRLLVSGSLRDFRRTSDPNTLNGNLKNNQNLHSSVPHLPRIECNEKCIEDIFRSKSDRISHRASESFLPPLVQTFSAVTRNRGEISDRFIARSAAAADGKNAVCSAEQFSSSRKSKLHQSKSKQYEKYSKKLKPKDIESDILPNRFNFEKQINNTRRANINADLDLTDVLQTTPIRCKSKKISSLENISDINISAASIDSKNSVDLLSIRDVNLGIQGKALAIGRSFQGTANRNKEFENEAQNDLKTKFRLKHLRKI